MTDILDLHRAIEVVGQAGKEGAVLLCLCLADDQWDKIRELDRKFLEEVSNPRCDRSGHAMFLVGQTPTYWMVKNTWGTTVGICGTVSGEQADTVRRVPGRLSFEGHNNTEIEIYHSTRLIHVVEQ